MTARLPPLIREPRVFPVGVALLGSFGGLCIDIDIGELPVGIDR